VIISTPHPDGDPNRCFWHVVMLMWLPPEAREAARQPLTEITDKAEHVPYFLALEQDYDQMQRQQAGLRQQAMPYMALTRQEVRLAYFHSVLDSWVEGRGEQ
jgi:Ring hydroxylating alpha subunit (catalytic domain)